MREPLTTILADDYVGALADVELATLRSRRAQCTEVETGLSYLRRVVQGRLDVVRAEQERRAGGGRVEDLADLIARLPDVLASHSRSPGNGRLPSDLGPGHVDEDLQARLDDIVQTSHLAESETLDDDELSRAEAELIEFEHDVSTLRRTLFDRIDAIEDEIARRYRTGEASVDALLGDAG